VVAEAQLRRVARAQHGVVSRQQLVSAGLSAQMLRTWVRKGRLHRIHRGVYAVADPALLPLAALAAALLATGPRAVLSHGTAAAFWKLAPTDPTVVHVMLPAHSRRHPGIETHRVRALDPRDVTTRRNLRLTAPARTVIDFATDAPLAALEHALSEGRALKLITDAKLEAALARMGPTHGGAAKVRALLRHHNGRVMTRSERERKMLALLASAGLPRPRVNAKLHGYEPDFYWPAQKMILEFDGYGTHGARPAFESDRKRDQTFAAAGIQTIRATCLQLEREPVALVVRVGQALATRTTH
jgi:very-short-patch-repair endonuclease